MWIARNLNGSLYLFNIKPQKYNNDWLPPFGEDCGSFIMTNLNYKLFPNITWEDEPLEVELISKKELEELEYSASQAPTVPYMGNGLD